MHKLGHHVYYVMGDVCLMGCFLADLEADKESKIKRTGGYLFAGSYLFVVGGSSVSCVRAGEIWHLVVIVGEKVSGPLKFLTSLVSSHTGSLAKIKGRLINDHFLHPASISIWSPRIELNVHVPLLGLESFARAQDQVCYDWNWAIRELSWDPLYAHEHEHLLTHPTTHRQWPPRHGRSPWCLG